MSTINTIPDITFIGGTTYYLDLNLNDELGIPKDLGGSTWTFLMARYGESKYVLKKIYAITDALQPIYTLRITISPSETISLSGVYSHQSIVEFNSDGVIYKPAQGIITIIPAIKP